MASEPIREKHHRLPRERYVGFKHAVFTVCIQDRVPIFLDAGIAQAALNILEEICRDMNARLWVALCMPDHLHLMVEGMAPNTDLRILVGRFKQQSGWLFTKNKSKGRWQKDYYDHVLRDDDDLENQARYILNNPVRSSLVDHWLEYPHKLSSVLDLTKRF